MYIYDTTIIYMQYPPVTLKVKGNSILITRPTDLY